MLFMDFNTGETFTIEGIRLSFDKFRDELINEDGSQKYADFSEYMEDMLQQGRERTGGYLEIGEG